MRESVSLAFGADMDFGDAIADLGRDAGDNWDERD